MATGTTCRSGKKKGEGKKTASKLHYKFDLKLASSLPSSTAREFRFRFSRGKDIRKEERREGGNNLGSLMDAEKHEADRSLRKRTRGALERDHTRPTIPFSY
jgi:hypothetical protein